MMQALNAWSKDMDLKINATKTKKIRSFTMLRSDGVDFEEVNSCVYLG